MRLRLCTPRKANQKVLLRGQSGTGRTTLAQNLGLLALQRGYSVRFTTLAAALGDLLKQESLPALDRRLRRYTRPDVLIIDEIGDLPQDTRSADRFVHHCHVLDIDARSWREKESGEAAPATTRRRRR